MCALRESLGDMGRLQMYALLFLSLFIIIIIIITINIIIISLFRILYCV